MRFKYLVAFCVWCLFGGVVAQAATMRILVVETSDAGAYAKALAQGEALLKSKGSQIEIRVWRARFAGADAGSVVISAEYPSLEALAKDEALMASDADLRSWLQSLDKLRKIVSDSIYSEVTP